MCLQSIVVSFLLWIHIYGKIPGKPSYVQELTTSCFCIIWEYSEILSVVKEKMCFNLYIFIKVILLETPFWLADSWQRPTNPVQPFTWRLGSCFHLCMGSLPHIFSTPHWRIWILSTNHRRSFIDSNTVVVTFIVLQRSWIITHQRYINKLWMVLQCDGPLNVMS